MYKRKNSKEKRPSLETLQSESFYIVKIDAPPGVEVPGGCYVTVQSGPHAGLKAAFERLRDPKPRAHTLPDIVFLPSDSSVFVLDEVVSMKPYMLVQCDALDRARTRQNPDVATTRSRPVRGTAEVPANLTTPPDKIHRQARLAYTDEMEKDSNVAEKRQKIGKLSPKVLRFEEQEAPQDGNMDSLSALRAACTAKLMWMLSNHETPKPDVATTTHQPVITTLKTLQTSENSMQGTEQKQQEDGQDKEEIAVCKEGEEEDDLHEILDITTTPKDEHP